VNSFSNLAHSDDTAKTNLDRRLPEESIHVVRNSVVDSIYLKRREAKPTESIFNIYPKLEVGEWIRMDIHRRENLTPRRFESIISALVNLIKNTEHKVALVMLHATKSALTGYRLESKLQNLL
jgi:UDP-N-acetylglucosamine 2-epimerase